MKKTDRAYRKLLAEQHAALRRLREEKGYSVVDIAELAGVTEYQAQKWLGDQLARQRSREILLRAADEEAGWPGKPGPEQRGAVNEKDRARRDRLLAECALTPARVRVRTLLRMIKNLEVTREAFARLLSVHRTTLYDYLDPENELEPTLPVVLRIKRLKQSIARGRAPASLRERFRRAARALFGEQIFDEGFGSRHALKAELISWLSHLGGLSTRTLYRWLPPYKRGIRPTRRVVEAFELAAARRRASPLRKSR